MPIYVVECADGCRYVGKSNDVARRLAQHRDGGSQCAAWVRAHGGFGRQLPTETESRADDTAWEHAETLHHMRAHGFNRVRGAAWTRCSPLTAMERAVIASVIVESGNLCRGCGMPGHFVSQCPGAPRADWLVALEQHDEGTCRRCGRDGHAEEACLEVTHARGCCLRCGRCSHTQERCFARTHVDGGATCAATSTKVTQACRDEIQALRDEVAEIRVMCSEGRRARWRCCA